MSFTEKIVVAKFSGKVMHSGKVMLDCTLVLWKRLAVISGSMGRKTVMAMRVSELDGGGPKDSEKNPYYFG